MEGVLLYISLGLMYLDDVAVWAYGNLRTSPPCFVLFAGVIACVR